MTAHPTFQLGSQGINHSFNVIARKLEFFPNSFGGGDEAS
jgi:hypothetical protein